MWTEIGVALGFVLIIEGMMPFLKPDLYRRFVSLLAELKDRDLRQAGFISMIAGVVTIYLVK